MVKQGVAGLVAQTFGNPVISAVEQAPVALPGKTRTETGLMRSEISSDFLSSAMHPRLCWLCVLSCQLLLCHHLW